MIKSLVTTAIVLTMANYSYQLLTNWNWAMAFERSFFQATALLCVGLSDWIKS